MGNQQVQQQQKRQVRFSGLKCTDDQMCQNIDSRRSKVDKLVYVCPKAKCIQGTCSCGKGCSNDPMTGMCCSKIERKIINGRLNTFCIEKPYRESPEGYCNI